MKFYNKFIYLFLFILLVKIIYIISEYFYNLKVLNISSSLDFFNEEKMENINNLGHLISSFGITLLLTPLIYFIVNKITKYNYSIISSNFKIFIFYSLIPIILFFTSYFSLNKLIDYVVEKNLDKSYQAYYLNIFKIGLMKNYYEYESFINPDNIKKNDLNINEKIMFVNTFLLLYSDQNLLNKLNEKGKNKFLNIYIDQNKEDFYSQYNQYLDFDKKILDSFEDFKNEKIKIKEKLDNLNGKNSNLNAEKEFEKLNSSLKTEYEDYLANLNKNKELINDPRKLNDIIDQIDTYLNNRNKYENNYSKKITSLFGKYIPVERFLDNNDRPNIFIFKNILKEELNLNFYSFEDFKRTKRVNDTIYKNLKNLNLNPTKNVDYTIESNFFALFNNNKNSKLNDLEKDIKNDLTKKLGENDLTLDMDYQKYINSNYIKKQILENLKTSKLNVEVKNIINVLNSKDKENAFKEEVYINVVQKNKLIEKYAFTEDDFKTNELAKELAIKSIKLLYIPIFAISISIISLLLNSVTLLTLIISKLLNFNKLIYSILNISIIAVLIYLPYSKNNIIENDILNNLANINDNFNIYIKFLDFVYYYEKLLS